MKGKDAYVARTFCDRAYLTRARYDRPPEPRRFLQDLRRFDRGLELHWIDGHWVLYRLARRGIVPSLDELVKEIDLPRDRDVGDWVIDHLRRHDKTDGGSRCPERGGRQWLQTLSRDRPGEEFEKAMDEISENATRQVEKFALTARFSREVRRDDGKKRRREKKAKAQAAS